MRFEDNISYFYEFPGGKITCCESFFDAVRREVKEETGLHITEILGEENGNRCGINNIEVECFKPFSVYQTVKGNKDSLGVHLICRAEGELLSEGDNTRDIKWIGLDVLQTMVDEGLFSISDKGAALFYLKENGY